MKTSMKKHYFALFTLLLIIISFLGCGGKDNGGDEEELREKSDYIILEEGSSVKISDYVGSSIDLDIPSRINNKTVISINEKAFLESGLMEINIPNTVKIIEDYAFSKNKLINVIIPNSVTYIGKEAFSNNNLKTITIPNSVISIAVDAFKENEEITIKGKLDSYARTFAQENNIKFESTEEIILESLSIKTPATKIKYFIGDSFDSTGLLILGKYNDGTEIEELFTEENITGFDTSIIGEKTITITIKGKTLSFLITIEEKIELESIEIEILPNKIEYIYGEEIDISGLVVLLIYNDGEEKEQEVFTEEEISGFDTNKIGVQVITVYIENKKTTFEIVVKAPKRLLTKDDLNYREEEESIEIDKYITTFNNITIPNEIDGKNITTLKTSSFYNKGLLGLDLPIFLTSIEKEAFYKNDLTKVEVPKLVKEIGELAFSENRLREVEIHRYLETIGRGAFYNNNIENIEIHDGTVSIEPLAFKLNNLKEIIIPDSVTFIGNSAFEKNNLNWVTLSNSITSIENRTFADNDIIAIDIPSSVKSIAYQAFDTNSLLNVIIPDSVESIGYMAFKNNRIKKLVLPKDITKIRMNTFENNKIEELIIPDKVTSIDLKAFKNNKITELVIPKSVITIESEAFADNQLESVTIPATTSNISSSAFKNNPNLIIKAYIGTAAHTYAIDNNITFEALED